MNRWLILDDCFAFLQFLMMIGILYVVRRMIVVNHTTKPYDLASQYLLSSLSMSFVIRHVDLLISVKMLNEIHAPNTKKIERTVDFFFVLSLLKLELCVHSFSLPSHIIFFKVSYLFYL